MHRSMNVKQVISFVTEQIIRKSFCSLKYTCTAYWYNISLTEYNSGTIQKCSFGVNITIELKHIKKNTPDNNGIWRGVFWLKNVLLL
jgi:hypothetical protein